MFSSLTFLDYSLIALGFLTLYNGWRRGLIMELFSIIGIGLGIWLANSGLAILYGAAEDVDGKRVTVTSVSFLAGIILGSLFGAILGNFVQRLIARGPIKLVNKISGSVFSLLTWSLVVWLISSYLILLPSSRVNSELNNSLIVSKLDENAPEDLRKVIDLAKVYALDSQLPKIAVDVIIGTEIAEPDPAIISNERIADAIDSVVRIESVAQDCNAKLTGSGFVISDNLVVTNAHVVAGISKPNVRVGGKGKAVVGEVIYFDPDIDLALIRTENLSAPSLTLGKNLKRSESAVVAGFPEGGSLVLVPARVKAVTESIDENIYGYGEVTRELYVLKADVKHGDSGAALINLDGSVSGVIFAASASEPEIGFALTNTELIKVLEIGSSLTEPVDTGKCFPLE